MSRIYDLHMNGDCWTDCPVCEHEELNAAVEVHDQRLCPDCHIQQAVADEFDDQIGYEEKARPVRVVALECGHDIVTEVRR